MKLIEKIFYRRSKPESSEHDTNRIDYLYVFYLLCIFIVFISILYSVILRNCTSKIGEFGDSFGGLSSIFSGLAFAGVIITIIMQMKELQLTREEMMLTRKELNRSAIAQEESQKALMQQLKSMKTSSNIDTLIYYLDKDLNTFSQDVYVAKRIIKKLTERLFEEDEYINFLQPDFQLLEEFSVNQKGEYGYHIKCEGLDVFNVAAYAVTLRKEKEIKLDMEKYTFSHGEVFTIYPESRLRGVHIYFILTDKRYFNEWELSLFVPDDESRLNRNFKTSKLTNK